LVVDKHYDIVIGGGGASGLSLIYRLTNPDFSSFSIAIIEPNNKVENDRTWCTWLKGEHLFDDCASALFQNIIVASKGYSKVYDINPYRYRMIKSKDFYAKVTTAIANAPNISRIKGGITSHQEGKGFVTIVLEDGSQIICDKYFKCFVDFEIKSRTKIYVDQHFKGFFISLEEDRFDPTTCTFMDFNIDQKGEVRFMYLLPTSKKSALVEVAIFSNEILDHNEYDAILKDYIKDNLKINKYKIDETEFGIIPMTTYDFHQHSTSKVIHLGTAGGAVKASTGFAFGRIQEQCDYVVDQLRKGLPIDLSTIYEKRRIVNDRTMLYVLLNSKHSGADFFTRLFQKNKVQDIFKFLDEETSLMEDLKLMSSCDLQVFAKAFMKVNLLGIK
jgi:lycopene beta-cyclase